MHITKYYLITVLLCTHMFISGMDISEQEPLLNNQSQEVIDTTIEIHKQDPKKLLRQSKFLSFSAHDMAKKLALAEQAVAIDPALEKNVTYLKKLTQLAWYYRYCPTFIAKGGRKKIHKLMQEHEIEKDTSWKNVRQSIAFILKKDAIGATLSSALIYSLVTYGTYKLINLIPITKQNNNPKQYLDFNDCLPHKTHIEHGLIKTKIIHFDQQLDSAIEECIACARNFMNPIIRRCGSWILATASGSPCPGKELKWCTGFETYYACPWRIPDHGHGPSCGESGVGPFGNCIDFTLNPSICNKFANLTKNPTHTICNATPFRWLTYAPIIFIPALEITGLYLRKVKQKLTACVRKKKKQIFEVPGQLNE